jgi:hypothetical protein
MDIVTSSERQTYWSHGIQYQRLDAILFSGAVGGTKAPVLSALWVLSSLAEIGGVLMRLSKSVGSETVRHTVCRTVTRPPCGLLVV